VLLAVFNKRYRANYGVTPNLAFNRLTIAPFCAKNVVVDRTEFGHPDVSLVLIQLSYYYAGLSNSQLFQYFNRLNEEEIDPASICDQLILYEDDKSIPKCVFNVEESFIDGVNRDIAVQWLDLSDKNKIDYVVYFYFDSLVVCDRQLHHYPFVTSPTSAQLDRCIFYLDELHTRGTDFKFPRRFKAEMV
ncbi:unnamed protein product, partial [Rotaria sp. Silwood1]